MLEIKNLRKIYKPKHGVPVAALDGVTIDFPDSGMVFLLGKSGSGKSTLLNLLGGLDKYDDGEIIIKGVSSKSFSQQHFDSYRNTYVGFIFQEYNVLEEFSVGANIALAIELQGQKASDEQINRILHEVDLDGYGNRKPNELSGGQKQRVAIARALVKNPEIIMADEPTGALDSNTGRQVLETLKRLSEEKLVIVVSHDREFAEKYADRIIELADGKLINDVSRTSEPLPESDRLSFDGDTVTVPADYRLTEQDRLAINKYLDHLKQDITIKAAKKSGAFLPTVPDKIKHTDNTPFAPVKSHLPLKNAFVIGKSGLKYKKIRLAFTIILSVIAFCLFGLADTFAAYDHVTACTDSIIDSNITYASISYENKHDEGINAYWAQEQMKQSDVLKARNDTGLDFKGVYDPSQMSLDFSEQFNKNKFTGSENDVRSTVFHGFAELTEQDLKDLDFKIVAGALPDGTKDEIAISMYTYDTFRRAGYAEYNESEEMLTANDYSAIVDPSDMVGRALHLGQVDYTVTGVIETGYDMDRYETLTKDQTNIEGAEVILNFALAYEMDVERENSLSAVAFVGKGKLNELTERVAYYDVDTYLSLSQPESTFSFNVWAVNTLDKAVVDDIVWFDGSKKSLGDKEMLVNVNRLYFENEKDVNEMTADEIDGLISSETFRISYYDKDDVNEDGYKIVGVFYVPDDQYQPDAILSDAMFKRFVKNTDRIYRYAVAPMPKSNQEIRSLVKYCYGSGDRADTRFCLNSPVTFELDSINEGLKILSRVFLYIGIGFAVFASLMLANFIGTSIVYKKREIGILRAIGSRSNDVFRIFFSESFIIAMINFVISSVLTGVGTVVINYYLRKETGMLITVLNFSVRQAVLLLAVSILAAFAASFFPVRRIASKRPIDAIRDI